MFLSFFIAAEYYFTAAEHYFSGGEILSGGGDLILSCAYKTTLRPSMM